MSEFIIILLVSIGLSVSEAGSTKAVAILIISVTAQQIFGGLYFVFTRCLKTSAGNMALSNPCALNLRLSKHEGEGE
jgi:hypothetical protein